MLKNKMVVSNRSLSIVKRIYNLFVDNRGVHFTLLEINNTISFNRNKDYIIPHLQLLIYMDIVLVIHKPSQNKVYTLNTFR